MRRLWQRERDGTLMVTLPLLSCHTAKQATLKYLRDGELEDRRAIAVALLALIERIKIER